MIGLYSPDLPPVPGGVADHTLMLARVLAARGAACTLLGARGEPVRAAPVPLRLGVTPGTLAPVTRELGLTGLLVQYVPFLYARLGVAPALCRALRAVREGGARVGLFVHEPYVPFTRLPWLVTGVLQRRQLRCLVRAADRVYAAVPRFAEICRGYRADRAAVTLAPIGANFEPSPLSRDAARAALGLAPGTVAIGVFSPAAAGLRLDWLRAAMQALATHRTVEWIVFGFGSERLFRGEGVPANVRALGTMGPTAVADTARALDLMAAPFADGLTMRRSSAMLGLHAGVPLVSSTGHLFDPQLSQYAACEDDVTSFVARVVALVNDPAARAALAVSAAGSAPVSSIDPLVEHVMRDLAA